MWDLIVSVPDHCLSFYFVGWRVLGARRLGCGGETTKGEGVGND